MLFVYAALLFQARFPALTKLLCFSAWLKMSAKHQENDTSVKANHLLLLVAVCQVLVPEHCPRGSPPHNLVWKNRSSSNKVCGVVTLVTYPAPSQSTTSSNGTEQKENQSPCPRQRRRQPQWEVDLFWSQNPPFPRRLQVGICVSPQSMFTRFQDFWNKNKSLKNRCEIHFQSRIKTFGIRMRQFISPLVVITT